jgi:two-component system sensor histidine kinase CpxA
LRIFPAGSRKVGVRSVKVTYPLSLKVFVWLLLNLLLLAGLGVGFFVYQGGIGWDALVAGTSGTRAQATANVIAGEAAAAVNAEGAQAVLDRFGAAYGADFYLFRGDEAQLAGTAVELPPEVKARIDLWPLRGFGGRGEFGPGARDPRRAPDFKGPRREPPDRPKREPGEMVRREPPPFDPAERAGRFVVRTGTPTAYWVGLRVPIAFGERGRFVLPGVMLVRVGSLWGLLHFLDLQTWLLAGTGVLLLSVLFWLPLVRGITVALGQLTAATEQIADGRFDARVPADRRDEIGKLGDSVNRMAARLDAHMNGQKRFLGDVAHELCSPLARLQMATGILDERAPVELRGTVEDVRDEVQQMSTLVNELLAFTKAGLQRRDIELTSLPLAPLVQSAIEREGGGERVTVSVPTELQIRGDTDLLTRALANLVRNALRYADASEKISVSARREGERVIVAVDDHGPGVPPEALDRLGEPFFRPEAARTRELGGVGLGLSIVRSAVVACGGEIRFSNRTPRGFRAEVLLTPA